MSKKIKPISVSVTQNSSLTQLPQRKFERRRRRAIPDPEPTARYPLRIERLPDVLQGWDEQHYWLIHQESGLRVPGSFSLAEARYIREISKHWDWSIDGNRQVACALQLMELGEALCSRSAKGGVR